RKTIPRWPTIGLIAIVFAQYFLFCYFLKWQVWHVRLLMALPPLFAPMIAWAWPTPRPKYASPFIAFILLAGLAPSFTSIRPPPTLSSPPPPPRGPPPTLPPSPDSLPPPRRLGRGPPAPRLSNQINQRKPAVIAFDSGVTSLDYNIQRLLLHSMSPPPIFTNI